MPQQPDPADRLPAALETVRTWAASQEGWYERDDETNLAVRDMAAVVLDQQRRIEELEQAVAWLKEARTDR